MHALRKPMPIRHPDPAGDAGDTLRHDLQTLLTPLRGRTQMAARIVATDRCHQQARLLFLLSEIDRSTRELADRIDRIDAAGAAGAGNASPAPITRTRVAGAPLDARASRCP